MGRGQDTALTHPSRSQTHKLQCAAPEALLEWRRGEEERRYLHSEGSAQREVQLLPVLSKDTLWRYR